MDELDAMMQAGNTDAAATTEEGTAPKKSRKKKEKAPKEKKPARDNIARINGMESIGEVRKALQIAIAKKAKANGKPDTQARYDVEIQTAREKLDALLSGATTVADLIKLGEDPNKIITSYLKDIETEFTKFCETNKVTKRVLKAVPSDVPARFYHDLPVELHDTLNTRHDKKDFRLWAACRDANLMVAVADGSILCKEGKWTLADGTPLGNETKEETSEEANG